MSAHFVYRVYDANGDLIYIGCTANLFSRLRAHECGSWWSHQGARVSAKVYGDRRTALAIEKRAIAEEHPRWNLTGAWKSNRDWSPQNYVDYVTSYLNQRERPTDFGREHLARVAAIYRHRFGAEMPVPALRSALFQKTAAA